MFSLKVFSETPEIVEERVERAQTSQPMEGSSEIQEVPFSSGNPRVESAKGVVHLFRNTSEGADASALPAGRSAELCVLAVPNYMTGADFCRFAGLFLGDIETLRIVRNDAVSDRFMVLMRMKDRDAADEFFRQFNGRPYATTEEKEVCRVLFTKFVEFTESQRDASTPPVGSTELPSCPVCLERLDRDVSGILTTVCNHSFHCACISHWSDSSCPVCRYCQNPPDRAECSACGSFENLWICLICGFVGCGRYQAGHAEAHFRETQHAYSLDLESHKVWDYVGDNYVHRIVQSRAEGKVVAKVVDWPRGGVGEEEEGEEEEEEEAAGRAEGRRGWEEEHRGKKGKEERRGKEEDMDEELMQAIIESKLEMHFLGLLRAKDAEHEEALRRAADAAASVKLQKLQSQLREMEKERDFLKQVNESLVQNQADWQEKLKRQEEREREAVSAKDARIKDLEEQVRDLMVYIEGSRLAEQSTEFKNGAVISVSGPGPAQNQKLKGARRRR